MLDIYLIANCILTHKAMRRIGKNPPITLLNAFFDFLPTYKGIGFYNFVYLGFINIVQLVYK